MLSKRISGAPLTWSSTNELLLPSQVPQPTCMWTFKSGLATITWASTRVPPNCMHTNLLCNEGGMPRLVEGHQMIFVDGLLVKEWSERVHLCLFVFWPNGSQLDKVISLLVKKVIHPIWTSCSRMTTARKRRHSQRLSHTLQTTVLDFHFQHKWAHK